jgi:hypothetical protein
MSIKKELISSPTKRTAKLSTVVYAGCPNCGNERAFYLSGDAIEDGRFRGKTCDNCHHVYDGVRENDEWTLDLKEAKTPTFVLLSLQSSKPVYFVVKSTVSNNPNEGLGSQEREEYNTFFYEENACPTNLFQCQEVIAMGGEHYMEDSHDLIKYVGEIDQRAHGVPCFGGLFFLSAFAHLVPDFKPAVARFDDEVIAEHGGWID